MVEVRDFRSLMALRASDYGDKEFIFDSGCGRSVSYGEFFDMSRRLALCLRGRGLALGSSVGFAMDNSWRCAVSIGACLYGGFRSVAINLVCGESTLSYVLEHSESQLVISDSVSVDIVGGVCSDLGIEVALIDSLLSESALIDGGDDLPSIDDSSCGLLIYTSGTTSRPKGVLLSHRNLYHGAYNCILSHGLGPSDIALCSLPFYHINGFCTTLLSPLVSGGGVVIDSKFSVSRFWDLVESRGCSWLSLVPTHVAYLSHAVEYDNFDKSRSAGVRFCRSASSALSPDLQARFESRFGVKIVETMGLSETSGQILSNPLPVVGGVDLRRLGSVGLAYGNLVKVMDSSGVEVSSGERGEICVRGDNVMSGYFKDSVADSASFCDGWFKSGDLGTMDIDGYVYVIGRTKELIIKGGENIAPREIDEVLLSFGGIIEAAAFAVEDKFYGESISAALVLEDSSSASESLVSEILLHCRHHLGNFKSPDFIYFCADLPKGPSGKIQRLKLKELLNLQ